MRKPFLAAIAFGLLVAGCQNLADPEGPLEEDDVPTPLDDGEA